jgi:hypothetical protein
MVVPQPDTVPRTRYEAPVGQHAQRGDRAGVAFEASGLGAGVRVPQPDGMLTRTRCEAPVGQHAQRMDPTMGPSRRAISALCGVKLTDRSRIAGADISRRAASRNPVATMLSTP